MLLTVPGGVKFRTSSSDNKASSSSSRRLPDVRRHSYNDDIDSSWYQSPCRRGNKPSQNNDDDSTSSTTNSDGHVSMLPRLTAKPSYTKQLSLSPMPDRFNSPAASLDDRPHSCDATTKPILALDRCHDCSTENVRCFVDSVEVRRDGGPVVSSVRGYSTEVLLEMESDETAGRKNVRFAPIVRVCDPSSTITFCSLRHQSASSAPALLEGASSSGAGGSSLPAVSSSGCVGRDHQSVDDCEEDAELAAAVERYLVRRRRHHAHDDSRDVHRFPPLRRRRH